MSEPASVKGFYTYCIVMLRRGFGNEHALAAWLRVRQNRINQLPQPLKRDVEAAIANCGPKEISK